MSNIYMKKTVFLGGILGAFIFISIYGIHIINGSYVDWISHPILLRMEILKCGRNVDSAQFSALRVEIKITDLNMF
jgi:hypothetical protein